MRGFPGETEMDLPSPDSDSLETIRTQLVELFPELGDLNFESVTTVVCALIRDFARAKGWTEMRQRELARLLRLQKEQNNVALFLRHHYASEIAEGRHNGLSFDGVITHYLAIERRIPFWMRRWTGK